MTVVTRTAAANGSRREEERLEDEDTEDTVGKGKRENREREGISFAEYTPVYLHGGRDLYTG